MLEDQCAKETQVSEEITRHQKNAERLDDVAARLRVTLESVLREKEKRPTAVSLPEEALVGLAKDMSIASNRIADLIDDIDDICNRCEL